MRLKNKKTGEIATLTLSTNGEDMIIMGNDMYAHITKLSELKDYEDYEEPKEYWCINEFGTPTEITTARENIYDKQRKNFGNYFDTKEQAEKAAEKLKAWKRLKDSKIKFCLDFAMNKIVFTYVIGKNTIVDAVDAERQLFEDMKIIFGGEE